MASKVDGSALDPMGLLGGLVLDDGRRWAEVATDWQRDDAAAVLDQSGPRLHFLTRARGGSKSTDEAGVALVVLLTQAPPASTSYVVAIDQDQAQLLAEAARGFLERSPALRSVLRSSANMITNTQTGASLTVLAGDGASAFGLRPYLVVVDEFAAWPNTRNHRTLWTALFSAMLKVAGARLVILTSAGDPAHWSYPVLEHARTSPRWRTSEVPGPLPWRSEDDLAEQRALLLPSEFARLHLNEWAASEDRLTNREDVLRCVRRDEAVVPFVAGSKYVVALDVGLKNDATVIAVGRRFRFDDGSTGVELSRMEVRQGSKSNPVDLTSLEDEIDLLAGQYGDAHVVCDPWQAVQLMQGLRRRRRKVTEFSFSASSVGRLGLTLYRLLRDELLDLPDDPALVDELANVRLRQTAPGSYRLDHDSGKHDDRAVALALLAYHLLDEAPRRRRQIVAVSGLGVEDDATAGGLPGRTPWEPR